VIVCAPAVKVDVLKDAKPPPFSVAVPSGVAPSRNVTVPLAAVVPD
jgi:hypothetical protein